MQIRHGRSESGRLGEQAKVSRSHAKHSLLSFWRRVALSGLEARMYWGLLLLADLVTTRRPPQSKIFVCREV